MNQPIIKIWILLLLVTFMTTEIMAQVTKKKTEKTKIVETFLESKPELDEDSIPIGRKRDEFITINPELMVITSENKDLPFDVPFFFTEMVKKEIYKITCFYMKYEKNWLDNSTLLRPNLDELSRNIQISKQDLFIDSLISREPEGIMKSEWKSPSKILVDSIGEKQRFILPIEPLNPEEEYLFSFAFTFKVDNKTHENLKIDILNSYNEQLITSRLYDYFRLKTLEIKDFKFANNEQEKFDSLFNERYKLFLNKQYKKINNSIRDTLIKKYFNHSQLANENYTPPVLDSFLYKNEDLINSLKDYILFNKNHYDYYFYKKNIFWNDQNNSILNEPVSTPDDKLNASIKAYIKAYKEDPFLLLKALRGFAYFTPEKGVQEMFESKIDSSCYSIRDYSNVKNNNNFYCSIEVDFNLKKREQELEKIIHYLDMIEKDDLKEWFLDLFKETLLSYEWLYRYYAVNDQYNNIVSTTSQKLLENLTSNLVSDSYSNTIGSFLTRAESYISADFGFNVMYDIENSNYYLNPHLGIGFGLGPLNRQAKYRRKNLGNFSFLLGLSYKNDYNSSRYQNLFGDFDLLTGIGWRFNDFARVSVGGRWNRKEQFEQLENRFNLAINPFIGLSIDWDVKTFFKNIFIPK